MDSSLGLLQTLQVTFRDMVLSSSIKGSPYQKVIPVIFKNFIHNIIFTILALFKYIIQWH